MKGREREEREATVALSRETAPSLETADGGEDAVRPRGGGGGGGTLVMWIAERIPLARNRTLVLACSIPLPLFFVGGRGKKYKLETRQRNHFCQLAEREDRSGAYGGVEMKQQ